jgi:hypothetical protein
MSRDYGVIFMSNIITPTFGGGSGSEPPKPPTYDELLFALDQQKELTARLRGILLARDDDHKKMLKACALAAKQLEELIKLQEINSRVAVQSAQNFRDLAAMFPTK